MLKQKHINIVKQLTRPLAAYVGIGLAMFYVLYSMTVLGEMPDLYSVAGILFPTTGAYIVGRSLDKRRPSYSHEEEQIYD